MTTGQALVRSRPQEQALVEIAKALPAGVVQYSNSGVLMIDLSGPELAKRCIVLAPATTMMRADPNFTPALTLVYLNPDPDAGDVYAIEKDQNGKPKMLAPTKVGLRKLGDKKVNQLPARIEYHGRNVTVTAGVTVRQPDGTWEPLYQSQDWDFETELEAVQAECPEKWGRGDNAHVLTPAEREGWIKKNWIQRRKSNLRVTESKAYNAAYREALPGLKQKYSPDELWYTEDGARKVKPFLIASTTFTPDTSNPAVLGMLMNSGQQAQNLLYGPASEGTGEFVQGEVIEAEAHEATPHDEDGVVIETHGERPTEDLRIPRGPYKDKMVSEVARDDPKYARETFVKSNNPSWGLVAEAWLRYYGGDGEVSGDVQGVDF